MSYHQWKRRLWGPDYPVYNGPPYQTPDGSPMLPGGIIGGPYQGVDDDGPKTGNGFTINFTGPSTGPLTVGVLIDDQTAAAGPGGRWVGCTVSVDAGTSAADIAAAVGAAFDAKNWNGWLASTVAGAAVTFNPQSAGNATGYVVYGVGEGGVGGGSVPVPPVGGLPPGGVDGPNQSANGVDFWLSRSGGQGTLWYYWVDVDNVPGPDTKRPLPEFLADENISQAYRDDVLVRAMALGYVV